MILTKIKKQILPFVPQWVIRAEIKRRMKKQMKQAQSCHPKILDNLREKDKIKVAFFVVHCSIWKCDRIFQLMLENSKFDPIIVICPHIAFGEDIMMQKLKLTEQFMQEKQYPYVMTLNFKTGEWLDVKKEIKPDIIFFTNPYVEAVKSEYFIFNFLDSLTCYVPYNFGNCHMLDMFYNLPFHNLLWRLFAETDIHKQFSIDVALSKGINVVTTGFPGTDIFIDKNYIPKNPWNKNKKQLKKIIWAPHHTINDFLHFSSFLVYADYILELAEKYKNYVQFAFKPHPLLKAKLYSYAGWNKERTDKYYNAWNNMENGQIEEGSYEDLFLTSDAMIHDCGSFSIEYLYIGKPVLRTDRDDFITDRMNKFGIMAYNVHYHARTKDDIETFVKNVIAGNDEMKSEREQFKQKYLLPPNGKFASQNIMDEITKLVCHNNSTK